MPFDSFPSPSPRALRVAIKAQVTETISTLREVVLMPRDLGPVLSQRLLAENARVSG